MTGTNLYSGTLLPEVTRVVERAGVRTGVDANLPSFGRQIYKRARNTYRLTWPALTHDEVRDLRQQWSASGNGSQAFWYQPDDRTEPIRLLLTSPPQVAYQTAAVASAYATAVEQR